MGPGNVGWGLFAQLQKFHVKCQKTAYKQAEMVSIFFGAQNFFYTILALFSAFFRHFT